MELFLSFQNYREKNIVHVHIVYTALSLNAPQWKSQTLRQEGKPNLAMSWVVDEFRDMGQLSRGNISIFL